MIPLADNEHLFTSESVTEGHPDKMADQISDAILDAALAGDPNSRVACETLITTGLVVVAGEITTTASIEFADIVRRTICDIGYDDGSFGFDGHHCAVMIALDKQSPDIAQGVDVALEHRAQLSGPSWPRTSWTGAGRRRPGHDVRLRHPGDPGADAAADRAGAPAGPPAGRGAQGRHAPLPAPGRQDPGHGALPGRRSGGGGEGADLHPARRGGHHRADPQGPVGARGAARAAAASCSRPTSWPRTTTSTRPAGSSSAVRSATPA